MKFNVKALFIFYFLMLLLVASISVVFLCRLKEVVIAEGEEENGDDNVSEQKGEESNDEVQEVVKKVRCLVRPWLKFFFASVVEKTFQCLQLLCISLAD